MELIDWKEFDRLNADRLRREHEQARQATREYHDAVDRGEIVVPPPEPWTLFPAQKRDPKTRRPKYCEFCRTRLRGGRCSPMRLDACAYCGKWVGQVVGGDYYEGEPLWVLQEVVGGLRPEESAWYARNVKAMDSVACGKPVIRERRPDPDGYMQYVMWVNSLYADLAGIERYTPTDVQPTVHDYWNRLRDTDYRLRCHR